MWISKKEYDNLKSIESDYIYHKMAKGLCPEPRNDNGLSEKVHNLEKRIFELEYDIKSPPKYKASQKTKYGICMNIKLEVQKPVTSRSEYTIGTGEPKIYREYTFMKGSVKTVITE